MKRKIAIALLPALVLGGLVLVPVASVAQAGEDGGRCRFEGAWFFRVPNVFTFYETVVSLDSANNSVGLSMNAIYADLTVGGAFPGVTGVTNPRGEGVRIGSRAFQYKVVAYGVGPSAGGTGEEVVWIGVYTGVKSFATDCRSYEIDATVKYYAAASDADGDGFPDPGAVPVVLDGGVFPLYRLTMD